MLLSDAAKNAADSIVLRLYEEAREDVYYYVVSLGLPAAQAQDVAQEVFLKLYMQLRQGEEIRSVRGWIFRVAHNEALKWKAKDKRLSDWNPALEPVSDAPGAEKRMLQKESRQRLNEALADLSPQQRQVLQLRAAGLRYREIADTIGVGVSTVNEFMRRGVARLRKAVQ
ncbi:MAG TPA: RNA polymerase sigma factor [Bryobacteraceae bacterium]|nr:RNA polymerase sigma factor [Bryobacteraceae bacterium]